MDQLQEMQAQIEQWKAMGLDLDAVQAAARTVYAGGTTPLGLSQWALGDKPRMEDFNRDNARVDELIGLLREELEKKVSNTKPDEYDLKLADGLVVYEQGKCKYHKNAFSQVTVNFTVATEDGTASMTGLHNTLFSLPEGFRPTQRVGFALIANGSSHVGGVGHIGPNGECIANILNGPASLIHGSVTFLAAD